MFSASYALARGKVDSLSRSVATDFGLSADLFDTIIIISIIRYHYFYIITDNYVCV